MISPYLIYLIILHRRLTII